MSFLRIRFLALAVLACGALLALSAGPASATQFPAVGGQGDHVFGDECPANEYLVGFRGQAGGWIDQISTICVKILPDGTQGTGEGDPGAWGGSGGTPMNMYCPPDSVLTALRITLTAGDRQVRDLGGICSSIRTGKWTTSFDFRAPTEDPNNIGSPAQLQQCPPGEVAEGIFGRYGKHLNAIGLGCRRYVYVPPPAPPASQPAPAGVIHHTGPASRHQAPSPFAGVWDTQTSVNAHYILTLNMNADKTVTGTFEIVDGDPKYNGTLTGTVNGPQLMLNYVQPEVNGSGTAMFMMTSDNQISGAGKQNDDAGTKFRWWGTRR